MNTPLVYRVFHRPARRLVTWSPSVLHSRALSTEPDTLKQKPKASTPLRRTASASLPIRSNPTPTRSPIRPVLTFATAERYLPTRLRPRLTTDSQKLHDAWWIPRWGQDGEIFVFGNGSFVCWGLNDTEARQFAKDILAPCEVSPLQDPETEELEFVTDPNECGLNLAFAIGWYH